MNAKRWLFLILITFILLPGCQGKKIVINQYSASYYKDRSEIFKVKTGIFLSDITRNYMIPVGIGVNKISIGEALEANAITSLGKIFSSVILISDKNKLPPDIERIISIEFGTETDVEWRTKKWFPLPVKEFAGRVKLLYKVYDKNWVLLFEGMATGSSAKEIQASGGFGGAAGGYRAGSAGDYELVAAVSDSLVLALEEINEQIISSVKK